MSDERATRERDVSDRVAEELLRLHIETYGKGAGAAQVLVSENAVVAFLDDLELLPNEEFMIDAGKADAVVEVRHQYQQAIETAFRAAVERATGRRVISFASVTKLDPNYVVEIFRLGEKKDVEPPEPA